MPLQKPQDPHSVGWRLSDLQLRGTCGPAQKSVAKSSMDRE